MTNMTTDKKENFVEAYHASSGNVSVACRKVGISRETYYRWCREDIEFKKECEEVDESLLDMAETMLLKAIRDGKTAELIFFLKTKGKSRGYVERSEVDVNRTDQDFTSYTTEELLGFIEKGGEPTI